MVKNKVAHISRFYENIKYPYLLGLYIGGI